MSRITRIIIDEQEYLDICRGRLRKGDFKKYLRRARITRRGAHRTIELPIDEIEIPSFRYGYPQEIEVGQGEGSPGDDLGPVHPTDDEGKEPEEGGQGHGDRRVIIPIPEEEFANLFQEVLQLPRIKPKGDRTIMEEHEKFTSIAHVGPESMMHLRRSFLKAIQRSIASGDFVPPEKTTIVVWPKDRMYRSWEMVKEPKNNAVIFYKRDWSGSMGRRERELVSRIVEICDFWLSWNYDKLETVFIGHDDQAEEVARQQFFGEDRGGGTTCSSALKKMYEIIEERFPVHKWNIYGVYLSDGLNWSSDNQTFVQILREKLLPIVNQYNYGQIEFLREWFGAYSRSGAGVFSPPGTIGKLLEEQFKGVENLAQTSIANAQDETIYEAIRKFFGKGN